MEKTLKQRDSNCLKICLFGPESSGKSTLSRKLAQHYNAPLVPEYARAYLQKLWDEEQKICRPKDLLPIAYGQINLENIAAQQAEQLLFCDTDLLTTHTYSLTYYDGWSPDILREYALKNTYDLYLLTYIDTPWVQDDLRDRPERRLEMFQLFENALIENNKPFVLVKGSENQRLHIAVDAIEKLIS